MKRLHRIPRKNQVQKVACTVSAAALMLGVSHAATVAMHFQVNYCSYTNYTGFPVTATAFGVAPSGWQNLTQMNTGYASCHLTSAPFGYTLSETVSTSTSTGGLNPLPNGSINVNWSGPTANFSDFGGYVETPPNFNINIIGGVPAMHPGEEQIYGSFIRDGINFGPPGGPDNTGGFGGYNIDLTGLKSVFTNSPFVVELIAGSDSMGVLTNAFVIDMVGHTTNSVTYPNTPPVANVGDAPWIRGHGGGLSTVSASLNTDHIQIISAQPQHGGTGAPPTGFNNAGTISGFIVTDKPVVTMSPQTILCYPGDTVTLNPYAIGVPPLSYQWRLNGSPIPGATTSSYTVAGLSKANGGNYDVVVTNLYGSAVSKVSTVNAGITMSPIAGLVADSNPANPERDGLNNGATWLASSSDGTRTRSGVMQFTAANSTGISVPGSTNFDSATGTMMFWMRSAGTDTGSAGNIGASILGRTPDAGSIVNDLAIVQEDGGNILFNAPATANVIVSAGNPTDNKWHLIALTYDTSGAGGAALYIDGVLDTTNANSAPWSPPVGDALEIGFTSDTNTSGRLRDYDGQLDDVRFYNRELTAAEIATVFSSGSLIDNNALQVQLNFTTAPVAGLSLTWPTPSSVLQSAPVVNGTYTDVSAAVSPYYVVPKTKQTYYRYRFAPVAPSSKVTNPYLM